MSKRWHRRVWHRLVRHEALSLGAPVGQRATGNGATAPLAFGLSLSLCLVTLAGCASVPAPASALPTQSAAIERLRASAPGCRAIQANAKVDRRGDGGRVAGDLMMLLESPQNIRMDIVSFGTTIATLTSDSKRFALMDMREKRFYVGSARPCNLARFTRVPIAGTALVELLRGQAPVLRDWQRSTGQEAPAWNNAGRYVVVLKDAHGNEEEIQLAPHPADLGKPWSAQRVRVHEVTVRQKGLVWYRAELSDHEPAPMGKESVDPDGIEAPVSPSGPMCTADIPRRIQVEVPWLGENVRFRFDDVTWNPPLSEGVFRQSQPGGTQLVPAECE